MPFTKATKFDAKARVALCGPTGSGKTYTGLTVARGLVGPTGKIAVFDTERGSASKYADLFDFDVLEPESHAPQQYMDALQGAEQAGYDVILIDSLSHAWSGRGGALEMVDNAAKRSGSGNSFVAWREVTPIHNQLVDALLTVDMHLIVTMRSKMEYVLEDVKGRKVPKKVGMAPVQREGMEYEFDIVADLDIDHNLFVTKTRCQALDGKMFAKPNGEFSAAIREWLSGSGARPEAPAATQKPQETGVARPAPGQKKRALYDQCVAASIEHGGENSVKAWLKDHGAGSMKAATLQILTDCLSEFVAKKIDGEVPF